jgi:hypothetical protein
MYFASPRDVLLSYRLIQNQLIQPSTGRNAALYYLLILEQVKFLHDSSEIVFAIASTSTGLHA